MNKITKWDEDDITVSTFYKSHSHHIKIVHGATGTIVEGTGPVFFKTRRLLVEKLRGILEILHKPSKNKKA